MKSREAQESLYHIDRNPPPPFQPPSGEVQRVISSEAAKAAKEALADPERQNKGEKE